MSKLKNIIKQLGNEDFKTIFSNLMENNAEKSAMLLKFLREKQLSDSKIMTELDVNSNAYYTLRSRLNEKIEEHLLKEMENPKTDILKKVASISEIIFTKKRTIVVTTLKKLEKELIDFDLSSELTVVYKTLKKLHINTPEHYYYSQLYNKHVAYTLAIDKAEDLLADYFKKFGHYFLSGKDHEKLELGILHREMTNIAKLYQSHRLFVYQSCVQIFHQLHVESNENLNDDSEPIEDIFLEVDKIFESYSTDAHYHHLRIVFDYLKLLYYNSHKLYKKAEKYYHDVNEYASVFLSNYSLYTFTPFFLMAKLDRQSRLENFTDLIEENKVTFADFETEQHDLPKFMLFHIYKAFCFYHAGKFDQSAKQLNTLLNEVSLKKYPEAHLEIKVFLAFQYCILDDFDLFNQLMNSIQRQIRIMGKDQCEHILSFTKLMKVSLGGGGSKIKLAKIKSYTQKLNMSDIHYFTPLKYVQFEDALIHKLAE